MPPQARQSTSLSAAAPLNYPANRETTSEWMLFFSSPLILANPAWWHAAPVETDVLYSLEYYAGIPFISEGKEREKTFIQNYLTYNV